ncbi:PAS domain-containing protein [Reichenbachiella versicolor]|uniref:PAS domain-containing protein n=1 Tax=Reichenbachiella versicolor TaxID=1821036 RepID=UPI000D6DDB09|nr:PAS domain S-box protein [Reichenbachiella versicolor]
MSNSLRKLRNKWLNQTLIMILILSCVAQVFHLIRAIEQNDFLLFGIQIFVISLLFLVTIRRKKIPLEYKFWMLLIVSSIMVFIGLFKFGFFSAAKVCVPLLPIYFSFIISYRKALIILTVYILVFMAAGTLYDLGWIQYSFDTNAYASNWSIWVLEASVIVLMSCGILYFSYSYGNFIDSNHIKLQTQHNELINSGVKFKVLFENAFEAIAVFDDEKIVDCNLKMCEYYGYTKDKLIGQKHNFLISYLSDEGAYFIEKVESMFKNNIDEAQQFECKHKHQSEKLFDVSVSLNMISLKDKRLMQVVIRDITERKKVEKELALYREDLEKLVKSRTDELTILNEGLRSISLDLANKSKTMEKENSELLSKINALKKGEV